MIPFLLKIVWFVFCAAETRLAQLVLACFYFKLKLCFQSESRRERKEHVPTYKNKKRLPLFFPFLRFAIFMEPGNVPCPLLKYAATRLESLD